MPRLQSLAWNYGYEELSTIISSNTNKHYLIDNTRNPRNYILPLFYLKLPYQNKIQNYYFAPKIQYIYSYQNMTFKSINWGDNISKYDYIVSDGLSISEPQAKDHNLVKIKTIITPINETVLEIFKVEK